VADTVVVEAPLPVPPLYRHPWGEVGFDFLVFEAHKWGRKLKALLALVVIRGSVVQGVWVMAEIEQQLRWSSDVEVLGVDRSGFVRCWSRQYPVLVHKDFDIENQRRLSQN